MGIMPHQFLNSVSQTIKERAVILKKLTHRVTRRWRTIGALGLAAVIAATTLAGCAASGSSGPVELKFLFPQYSTKTAPLMQHMVDDFNTANQGKIHVTMQTASWDKMHDVLTLAMGSNKAPDVFGYANRWMSEFVGLGQLAPLDSEFTGSFKQGFIGKVVSSGEFKGKLYGLPAAVSARQLYYRTDLFAKAGLQPPKTWDDLLNAAIKTTNAPTNYGLGVPATGIEVDTFLDYFLYNNGGDILDSKGKSLLSSSASVDALTFLTKLVKQGGSEPNPVGFNRDQITEQFQNGQLSMYPTGPWLNAMIKANNPTLPYATVPFPTNGGHPAQTVAVADSLGISSKTAHQAEAWKFVQFMYQAKYRSSFDQTEGMLPELQAVADSPYYQAPAYKPFVDALQTARFQPQNAKFEQIQQIMTTAVQKAITGQETPKAALDEATAQIDKL
jgi:multiple sugar transport system substrate-binding protein